MFKKAMYIYDAHDYTLISFFFFFFLLFFEKVLYCYVHISRNSPGPGPDAEGANKFASFCLDYLHRKPTCYKGRSIQE